MQQKGYKKLGSGMDAVAFLAPNGTILKIFKTNMRSGSGFSEGQRMCVDWIKYCQANKNNPFLPKFSGFESFEFPQGSGQMYLQIRMERLGNFPMQWNHELADLADMIDRGNSFEHEMEERLPSDEWGGGTCNETATLAIHLGYDGMKKLWNTMKTLNGICNRRRWQWDLHSGNFMIRNDGTPVILDPYFLGHHK